MPQPYRHISVSSPGKVLIAGEYAVLYGASALSLAVNRRAQCALTVRDEGLWQLRSSPPFWNETRSLTELLSKKRTDTLGYSLTWFSQRSLLPEHVAIHMDTEAFFSKQRKLGLGSSAGVLVSLYASLATLIELPMNAQDLLELYRTTGDNGSGVDVVTSYQGGLVRLKGQTATSVEIPEGIYLDIYAVPFSTETAAMVDRFRLEFDNVPVSLQESFIGTANTVADSLPDRLEFLDAMQRFVHVYRELDSATKLSIWSTQHETMYHLASEVGALYKPSGAGGGDIGVAIANDPQNLAALRDQVTDLPVTILDLQKDANGVRIEQES